MIRSRDLSRYQKLRRGIGYNLDFFIVKACRPIENLYILIIPHKKETFCNGEFYTKLKFKFVINRVSFCVQKKI